MASAPNIDAILSTIRLRETGKKEGVYNQPKNKGGASGAYQYIDSTWKSQLAAAGLGNLASKYPSAYLAPKSVQDAVATHNVQSILKSYGNDVSKVPVAWYYPKALTQKSLLDTIPAPQAGNNLTIREYANRWVKDYNKMSGSTGLWSAAKDLVAKGVGAVATPAASTGTSYVAGSVPTTAIGSAAVSTAAPQINILDVLAQALGLVQAQQPAQVDLSSYVQQVAAQRSAALTDELATIERMKADAINRVRAQYGISQQGLATASAGAGVDLGAIGALNTAPGATTDIAAQMAALGYNPSLATSQVAPDLATLAAQQAATGGLIGGITAGTQAGINDTMSQQLAAMQSASLGDLETAAALQALKTKAASNADAQNFAQQMQALAAQANIANEQNRIPQLLQAISAVGGLQQANAQLAQSGTGQAIDLAQLQAQISQNNVSNQQNAARMEQDAQQFAATYGLNAQELLAKIKANTLNDKLTTAQIANTQAETDYRKAQTQAAKNPTATLTAAEQTRQRSIAAAAPQNKSLISAYKASNIAPAVKKAGSARAAFSSVNVKTIPSNQIDTILVAFALDGDVEGARSFVDNYWRNQDIVKNAGKSAKTAAKKSEAVQKELNDRKTTSMNTYYRLVGQGRLGMTPEDFAAYPDSFITG